MVEPGHPQDSSASAGGPGRAAAFDRDTEICVEQATGLYGQNVPALIANPLIAVILSAVFWGAAEPPVVALFVGAHLVLAFVRYADLQAFRRTELDAGNCRRWLHRFVIGVLGVGLLWAAGTMVFFRPENPAMQVLLVFSMGGMAAGAVTTNSHFLPSFYAFLVPALGPLAVRLLAQNDSIHVAMGLMLLVFVGMLAWIGRYMSNRIMQNVQLRLELTRARDAAESANRAKAEFLSVVTHELRTPLTSIRGALGLMASGKMGEIPGRAQNMVDIALRNSVRLNDLIDDILDTEALDTGEFVIEKKTQPLAPLVRRALEENAQFAARFGVRFDLCREDKTLAANVDGRRFIQVLANLLSNAVKFSPPGEGVSIALEEVAGHARISVRDRGPGVAPDFQHRLFEKFAQADSSNTRGAGGTGLGLSISKSIVERLGGRIGFDDPADGGSIFFVEVPVAPRQGPRPAPGTGEEPSP